MLYYKTRSRSFRSSASLRCRTFCISSSSVSVSWRSFLCVRFDVFTDQPAFNLIISSIAVLTWCLYWYISNRWSWKILLWSEQQVSIVWTSPPIAFQIPSHFYKFSISRLILIIPIMFLFYLILLLLLVLFVVVFFVSLSFNLLIGSIRFKFLFCSSFNHIFYIHFILEEC